MPMQASPKKSRRPLLRSVHCSGNDLAYIGGAAKKGSRKVRNGKTSRFAPYEPLLL